LKEVGGRHDPVPERLVETAVEADILILIEGDGCNRALVVRFSPSPFEREKEKNQD
jgi:hypothetical protein